MPTVSAESLFTPCGRVALLGWILLLVAPRWRWPSRIIVKFAIPLILAAVGELFADPWILLAGRVRYLALDLFLGTWEVRDAAREGVPHWLVAPCLMLTFLVGPVGLLAYGSARAARRLLGAGRPPLVEATRAAG